MEPQALVMLPRFDSNRAFQQGRASRSSEANLQQIALFVPTCGVSLERVYTHDLCGARRRRALVGFSCQPRYGTLHLGPPRVVRPEAYAPAPAA